MPKKHKLLTAIAVAALMSSFLHAAPGSVKSISVDDGLSQSMVYCMLQDSRGFMWFGTQDGLNRYDGRTVKVYRHNPDVAGSPCSDRYFAAWQAPDSRIWFGTNEGICLYSPSLDRFSRFGGAEFGGTDIDFCVRHISGDGRGNVWIAGDGASLFRYDRLSGRLSDLGLRGWALSCGLDPNAVSVKGVVPDGDSVYVAASGAGLLKCSVDGGAVTELFPVGGG